MPMQNGIKKDIGINLGNGRPWACTSVYKGSWMGLEIELRLIIYDCGISFDSS